MKNYILGLVCVSGLIILSSTTYFLYEFNQRANHIEQLQEQKEKELKDMIITCANESVDNAVEIGKKLRDSLKDIGTSGGGDEYGKLLIDKFGSLLFPTSYKGDDGYSYQTYQDNYTICMQSHGFDVRNDQATAIK